MPARRLGSTGPNVSSIGLGCMGMSGAYGQAEEAQSIATIHRAIELGVTFIDTADIYGFGHNERLVGKALLGWRHSVVLATKFGNRFNKKNERLGLSGKPTYVAAACDASLSRLQVDYIDLYYLHRVDPNTPVEDSVGAMADLVRAGKVRHIGLSEATPQQIRRAHEVHPIAAVQSEYSLWTRDHEAEILPTTRELGIGFVAFSPLGRGFLTGTLDARTEFAAGDNRRRHPRFDRDNMERNAALAATLIEFAHRKRCSPAQVALGWVLAQGNDIIPIPGTRNARHLDDNLAAADVTFTSEEIAELSAAFPPGRAAGSRLGKERIIKADG